MNSFIFSLPELFYGNYNDSHPYTYEFGIPAVTLKFVKTNGP
jgi:hypothetical protein